MSGFSGFRKQAARDAALERAIWAVALVVTVAVTILAAFIGDWLLLVGLAIIMAVSLMRWRGEARAAEPDVGDHGD